MLTDDEIARGFRLTMGVRPRWADIIQGARLCGGTPDQLGSYLWCEWFGRPDEPSEEQIQAAVRFLVRHPWLDDDVAILLAQRAVGLI